MSAPYGPPPQRPPSHGGPPYGQPSFGQPPYGQPPYGPPRYGAPPYGGSNAAPLPTRAGLAIGLSLVVCFVMPLVYFVLWLGVLDRNHRDLAGPLWMGSLAVGVALWLTSLVLSIRGIVRSGKSAQSSAGPTLALVFTIFGALTGPGAVLVGLLLATGWH